MRQSFGESTLVFRSKRREYSSRLSLNLNPLSPQALNPVEPISPKPQELNPKPNEEVILPTSFWGRAVCVLRPLRAELGSAVGASCFCSDTAVTFWGDLLPEGLEYLGAGKGPSFVVFEAYGLGSWVVKIQDSGKVEEVRTLGFLGYTLAQR